MKLPRSKLEKKPKTEKKPKKEKISYAARQRLKLIQIFFSSWPTDTLVRKQEFYVIRDWPHLNNIKLQMKTFINDCLDDEKVIKKNTFEYFIPHSKCSKLRDFDYAIAALDEVNIPILPGALLSMQCGDGITKYSLTWVMNDFPEYFLNVNLAMKTTIEISAMFFYFLADRLINETQEYNIKLKYFSKYENYQIYDTLDGWLINCDSKYEMITNFALNCYLLVSE